MRPSRAQNPTTVTNVFQNHYGYGYPLGAAATDCPTGYNIPTGQYPSTYHLERGHAIHHLDPLHAANDYWVYWAHFDNGGYGIAEVAVFKSTTECGPYLLQTGLSTATNTDGGGYGFQPGGWQSRDEIIFRDSDQTYNPDGTVAKYSSAYLISASDSLNSIPGHTCGYANDSLAAFKMTPDYMGIDATTSPSTNGANWIFPCAQREAPVMFRQGSTYFLIVSQAAGWYPSQGGYGSSSNPLTGFPVSPLSLGNTSTFGGQTSDGITIQGTTATTYLLTLDHLGGDDSKNPAASAKRDTGGLYLPVILDGAAGTATLNWAPSFTIDQTTGVLTLPTLTNLATTGTASATTYSGTSNLPSAAIDDNYTTRWAYAASSGTSTLGTGAATFTPAASKTSTLCPVTGATATTTCNPSLVVDMGSVQPVQELDLSWYMIKGSEPYYTFKVAYSNDNATWTTLDYTSLAPGSSSASMNIGAVPFSNNTTYGFNALPVNFSARYVAVTETSEVVQNNSPGNYGPSLFEMGIIQSTAPASPQPVTVSLTPSTTSTSTSNSFSIGVAVSGPDGQAIPTGYIQLSAPGFTSDTASLVNGANSITVPAGSTTGGNETITVSYRPDPTSAPVYGIGTTTATVSVSVTAPTPPSAVTTAQTGPGLLTVGWAAATGANSYVLYRSLDGGGTYSQLATLAATSYVDSGLANDSTHYCYTVASVNSAGTSAPSSAACSTATANFPVTNITLTQGGTTQLTVAYTAVASATSYAIKRSAAGGAYAQVATPATTSYTDTAVTNGTQYCYTVAAIFPSGPAADSAPICATVNAAIANLPVNGFSFEAPATGSYVYAPAVAGTSQPWTFTASGTSVGSGVTTNASGFTAGNSAAPVGTQVAFLQGKGVAFQTLTNLMVGTTYKIVVAASQRANKSGGQLGNPFEIRVDGTAIATIMAPQGTTTYNDFSATFKATATSQVIGFYGTNANATGTYPDNTVFIDNVRLISYPPSSTALTATPGSSVNAGTVITLSAAVTSPATSAPVTAGTINFYDGSSTSSALIGTASLNSSGLARFNIVPGVGIHTFLAEFQGTSTYPGKTSSQQTLAVVPAGNYQTTGLLTVIPGGLSDTMTFYGQAVPGGTVQFTDTTTGTILGTVSPTPLTQTFSSPVSYVTGAARTGALVSATGDFNNDGYPDVAVTNLVDGTVSVLLGIGNGGFQPQVSYAAGSSPYGVAVGDFNGDGNADLVVTNLVGGTISVLLGTGNGSFGPPTSYPTGRTGSSGATTSPDPFAVSVADMNQDGFADLVVTNTMENSVSVLLGSGTGGFAAPVTTSAGADPFTTAVADFSGDGIPDLVVINARDSTASYLIGKGDGTFILPTVPTYPTGRTPYAVAVGDYNGDGRPDLAIANLGDPNAPPTNGSVTILLGSASGGFTSAVYPTGVEPTGIVALDYDGDGKQDLAVANLADNTIGILKGNGTGGFAAQTAFPTAANPYALSVADLNGDGKQDLVITAFGGKSLGIQMGTQTDVVTLNGVPGASIAGHTVVAAYVSANNDAYITSSSTMTVANTSAIKATNTSTKH